MLELEWLGLLLLWVRLQVAQALEVGRREHLLLHLLLLQVQLLQLCRQCLRCLHALRLAACRAGHYPARGKEAHGCWV